MNKRTILILHEPDAVIVQLLGGDKKGKALIEAELFRFAEKQNINIVVRRVDKGSLSKNYAYRFADLLK